LSLGLLGHWSAPAVAQSIIPDATLDNPTMVNQVGNLYEITGGTTRSANLFHSFDRFSLNTGETAHFDNAPGINNIFARVTGGSPSTINGILQANGSASLFLMNPNGIIFQENAQLDIGGSFIATTADSIQFLTLNRFSATEPADVPLFISIPVGLQFGTQSQGIQVSANLQVPSGESLILAGHTQEGNDPGVVVTGTLLAPDGRIELASVGPTYLPMYDWFGWRLGSTNNLRDIVVNTDNLAADHIDILARNLEIDVPDDDPPPEDLPDTIPDPSPDADPEPDSSPDSIASPVSETPDAGADLDNGGSDPGASPAAPISGELPSNSEPNPSSGENSLLANAPVGTVFYMQSYRQIGRANGGGTTVEAFVAIPYVITRSADPVMPQCEANQGNDFVITGRGGLPASEEQTIAGETVWQDMRLTEVTPDASEGTGQANPETLPSPDLTSSIVEAQSWVRDAEGQVHLVAPGNNPAAVASSPPPACIANLSGEGQSP
jgi:filamentous hemagglutinin family protein